MEQIKTKRVVIRKVLKISVRVMLALFGAILLTVLILFFILLSWSSGKMKPFIDENGNIIEGSLSEKIFVEINDVKQGMIIKSKNENNPVLLFLHGGPGIPEYFLTQDFPTGLEDLFTVCWWEQRGSGLSYNSKMNAKTLTVEQLIQDTFAVTDYLRERFGQEKIYLMAHSWGTYLGIQAVARQPQLYKAYFAVSQVTQQLQSEKLAYEYMLKQFELSGNNGMVKELKKIPIPEMSTLPSDYLSLRDDAMHKLGIGTMRNMNSVISGIFMRVMKNREYTLSEKINVWRGKSFSLKETNMWAEFLATNIPDKIPKIKLPIYFFHGEYDYTCSYALAKSYFDILQAPTKEFYSFANSAHSPIFEEPEKVRDILNKIIEVGL